MDLSALHSFLKTKTDANELNALLEKLNGELYRENFTLSDFLAHNTSYDLKPLLEKTIQDSDVNVENRAELRTFIINLQDEIGQLPMMHIILSFVPSEKTIKTIRDWFYDNYKKVVLLDLSVDKSIIAGSVISFQGRANDYSLATRIDQMA